MIYVFVALAAFAVGVVCAGYVVAAIGGVKTDIAQLRTGALSDWNEFHNRLSELETTVKAKLP